ncbi:hypothetical protein [Streptomyces nigrescens]|uniref:hypothetical protein n=1 Tax=Streptomyces nigrescens TaxID=1920 RepID=UPI0036F9D404
MPSVFFTVTIDGSWQIPEDTTPPHSDLAGLARHHLREHARHTLAGYSVLDVTAAQDAVNSTLSQPLEPLVPLTTQGMAQLTVSDHDRALAQEHVRKEQLGDLDREETRRRIAFLQRVLADPDQRSVWWIDQYPDRLAELGLLNEKAGTIQPPRETSPNVLRDEVVRFIDQLLNDIRTPQQREIFLRALTQTLQTIGTDELHRTATHWLTAISRQTESGSA